MAGGEGQAYRRERLVAAAAADRQAAATALGRHLDGREGRDEALEQDAPDGRARREQLHHRAARLDRAAVGQPVDVAPDVEHRPARLTRAVEQLAVLGHRARVGELGEQRVRDRGQRRRHVARGVRRAGADGVVPREIVLVAADVEPLRPDPRDEIAHQRAELRDAPLPPVAAVHVRAEGGQRRARRAVVAPAPRRHARGRGQAPVHVDRVAEQEQRVRLERPHRVPDGLPRHALGVHARGEDEAHRPLPAPAGSGRAGRIVVEGPGPAHPHFR
ncbi:hypothetical protein ABXN37_16950 [Piscinibacter sakaiensis]|uniref:hypothetical protein n=1 Tax=Piscinibacter sakaiensis TaxID=1547922 RepID=UPI003729784E